jgi:DNA (cytosine-5)-methyltransferase 1
MKKRPTALGAYIFAGGFTLGVAKHFDVLAHLEDGPFGVDTVQRNLELPVFTKPDEWPLEKYRKRKVDFIYANPPCAPWSSCSAGRATSWQDDPRLAYIHRTMDLLDELVPKVLAIESVRPFFTKGRGLVDQLIERGNARGYHATVALVEASRHGVAQHRPRLFFILSRVRFDWLLPKTPMVHVKDVLKRNFRAYTTIRLGPQYDRVVKHTKPGERAARVFNRLYPKRVLVGLEGGGKVVGRPSFQLQRLDPEGFCSVLTGDCRKIHPTLNRMITVEEAAALSGFPHWYKFSGGVGAQTNQIAKGVMPPVGAYLAGEVARGLELKRYVKVPGFEVLEVFRDKIVYRES